MQVSIEASSARGVTKKQLQVSIEASSARGVTTKQLDAGPVPHFSSLDAGQYGRLKVMTVVDIQHSEHILSDRYR